MLPSHKSRTHPHASLAALREAGELGLAFTELYKAGMHEVEGLGRADAGHGLQDSAQSAAALDAPCAADSGGTGYLSLAPAAWALIAAGLLPLATPPTGLPRSSSFAARVVPRCYGVSRVACC